MAQPPSLLGVHALACFRAARRQDTKQGFSNTLLELIFFILKQNVEGRHRSVATGDVLLHFDFLSVGETISPHEVEMLRKRTKIDEATAYQIIQAGAELRRQYKAGDLPYGPSLGDLINWATLVHDGNTAMEAAEETIIGLTSDNIEVQADVRRILETVFNKQQ